METSIDLPSRPCLLRNVSVESKWSVSTRLVDGRVGGARTGHTSRNEFQVSSWAAPEEETTWRAPRPALVPSEPPEAGLLPLLRGVPTDGAAPSTAASDKYSAEGVSTAWSMLGSVLSPMLLITPRASLPSTSSVFSDWSEGEE